MGADGGVSGVLDAGFQLLVEFPYYAVTTPRQRKLPDGGKNNTKHSGEKPQNGDAGVTQRDISEKLYQLCTSKESVSLMLAEDPSMAPADAWKKLYGKSRTNLASHRSLSAEGSHPPAQTRNGRAATCGQWGPSKPSELFLTMYRDALHAVEDDPSQGLCSPSLLGSSGTVPLSIISTIPDIARHMSNIIVRAEREVILATNYWQDGVASAFITNAMRELSRRAGERGTKVVMKILYDRGSLKQLYEQHQLVPEKEWTGKDVHLPAKKDIPHIDLQVMNFHRPMLGTMHSKFMVVDRQIAMVQSNNIMDNDNVEMAVHLEGPIVDSIYDMFLISWHKKLDPPLPTHKSPATEGGLGTSRVQKEAPPDHGDIAAKHVGETEPTSQPQDTNGTVKDETTTPPNSLPETARGAKELSEHTTDSPHYDDNLGDEVARVQASVSPHAGLSRGDAVTAHLNHTVVKGGFKGSAPEPTDAKDFMTPYVTAASAQPVPIAMVNRVPYGRPNNKSVVTPQNEAWLSALRNARESVFIQSPTLNGEPLVPAIIEACERGVDVTCFICIGYNDAGELLPMQGGHNDMVAHQIASALSPEGKKHLHYFWYVGKDQDRPILQTKKKRSCHIKLLIADGHVGIVGSGNQDTQSWFHSQEVNVMVDSPEVCAAWADGIRRNQNTHLYGRLQDDGVWRDDQGKEVDGAIGVNPGRFSWARGIVGAVKRVQGKGGFG